MRKCEFEFLKIGYLNSKKKKRNENLVFEFLEDLNFKIKLKKKWILENKKFNKLRVEI